MNYNSKVRNLQSLVKDMENDNISLSHKLQRPEGQWNKQTKSELIDSLLRSYPINPSYAIREDGKLYIIDGIQRLSTIRDYLNDKFVLSELKPFVINGEEVSISGVKFSELPEHISDILTNCELQIYEMVDCTEEDVREMFRRQNAGKPLNNKQMRVVYESDVLSEKIYELANHDFMNKLMTNTQRKNSSDRDIIIQTLMLASTNTENDFTSFRSKDMDAFVKDYADDNLSKVEILTEAMDKLAEHYDKIKIAPTSIPMILYSAYRVTKDKKSFTKLIEAIDNFNKTYSDNEEYKMFVKAGTTNQENVRGRFNYWRNIVRELQ